MAEILFGSARKRINIKRLHDLMKMRPREHDTSDRLRYILETKKELDLDNLLRHSNRQMAYGSTLIRQTPVFKHEPRRFPMFANPAYVPYEDFNEDEEVEDGKRDKPDDALVHKEFTGILDQLKITMMEEGGEE